MGGWGLGFGVLGGLGLRIGGWGLQNGGEGAGGYKRGAVVFFLQARGRARAGPQSLPLTHRALAPREWGMWG